MAMPNDMENASVGRSTVEDEFAESNLSSNLSEAAKGKAKQKGSNAVKDKLSKSSYKESTSKSGAGGGDKSSSADTADKASGGKGDSGKSALKGAMAPDDGDSKGGGEPKEKSPMKQAKTAKNVAKHGSNAASGAMKFGVLAKMMNFAQMMLTMGLNALTSAVGGAMAFLGAIWGAIQAVGSAIVGFVAGIGSAIAGVLGIGASVATAVTSIILVFALAVGVVTGVVVVNNTNVGSRDGALIDCTEDVRKAQSAESDVDTNAMTLENAKKIWSAMKTYGLSDDQIAGILGNFSAESGIDPTTIEGIYTEPHNINGSRHQSALKDLDAYVRGPLSQAYSNSGTDYTQNSGYMASDGKKYPGIGLAQWTGGGAMNFINFADSVGQDWWSLDYQIAYMLAKNAPTGAYGTRFWDEMKAQTSGAEDMATWFAKHFEGNTVLAGDERRNAAADWKSQMSGWTQDSTYGDSVIALAQQLGATATDNTTAKALNKCIKDLNYDNSTLAAAAVAYAYETQDEGRGNDGTDLYRRLLKAIAPGDPHFQSCDRGVATAVRWSGTDDTFPMGATNQQLDYLQTSEKWTEVGASSSLSMDDLMPGDVFCLDGHIFIYVGTDVVKAKYPNSNGDSVSASYQERSPGVGIDATDIIVRLNGQDWIGRGEYYVFRCSKPDNSTTYKDAGAGGN